MVNVARRGTIPGQKNPGRVLRPGSLLQGMFDQ
jgi:hypothetical protein